MSEQRPTGGKVRNSSRRDRVSQISLDALTMPRSGKSYDLSSGWWTGMPLSPAHPSFQLLTYRSPAGERNQDDIPLLSAENNKVNFGFISELMMCTMHTGTHIDALSHITCGPESHWHGGHSAHTELGDFGPMNNDAADLPPMLSRGVMLDIPGALNLPHLAPGQAVTQRELQLACERNNVQIRKGDVVLVRTGTMLRWPDTEHIAKCEGSGLSLEGAEWLVEKGVSAVGGDNVALEVWPSGVDGDPQPVHRYLIQEQGIPILEWVYQEDLARDGVSEFLFICLPLPVTGATGSLVRPLAII